MPDDVPVKNKSSSPASWFALLFAGTTGIAGSYAWSQHEQGTAAAAQLTIVASERDACTTELAAAADQATTCASARSAERSDRAALGTDLLKMRLVRRICGSDSCLRGQVRGVSREGIAFAA